MSIFNLYSNNLRVPIKEQELAAQNKQAVIISGATGKNSGFVNGIYTPHGVKDNKLVLKNLVNQRYLHCGTNGNWYAATKADFESNKNAGFGSSVEAGFGHPSLVPLWKVAVNGEFELQIAVKVAALVSAIFFVRHFPFEIDLFTAPLRVWPTHPCSCFMNFSRRVTRH